ncbi:outer membrane lipoprotein-sorting protein [bacterium]|nr:outer membrane lipoprotein-sorting protein [bacterium]
MQQKLISLFLSILFLLFCFSVSASPSAEEIIIKADLYRGFGDQSFSANLVIISHQPDKAPEKNILKVMIKSKKSLVQFLFPQRIKGRAMLFEGRNLWLQIPKTRKAIRISPAQRLMGESSNGDVASTHFSGDYEPTLIDEQVVDDTICYHLTLTAVDKKVTYDKIEYWVAKESGKPVMSKHFAASGKLLKTAYYKSFIPVDGQEKLERLLLVNPLFEGRYTWMIYSSYKMEDLPPALFRKENLNRM